MITIALFVYNRPEHTHRTLLALQRAKYANMSHLYIFSDGAKSNRDKYMVDEVRSICSSISGFASVEVVERQSNVGLAHNIISGLDYLFKQKDRVIVLEDDLLVSYGFIEYMVDALEFYSNKGVFSISGYTPNVMIPVNYSYSTYIVPRNCSWGWATWKEKWNKVDWNVSDFNSFICNNNLIKSFNKAGNDLTPMLLKQQLGIINSWSIRFTYAAFKLNEPSVYPIRSLIENNGVDGSGTNMRYSNRYMSIPVHQIESKYFVDDISVNNAILRSFSSFYNTSIFRSIINYFRIKKYIKSIS